MNRRFSIRTARMAKPMVVDTADELTRVMTAAGSLANLAATLPQIISPSQGKVVPAKALCEEKMKKKSPAHPAPSSSKAETADKKVPAILKKKRLQYRRHAVVKHKRRYCRMEGCGRIVKAQGLCQRHGALTRSCKIPSCKKQAQGSFDGMCKAHYRQVEQGHGARLLRKPAPPAPVVAPSILTTRTTSCLSAKNGSSPQRRTVEAASVFDHILPESIRGWDIEEQPATTSRFNTHPGLRVPRSRLNICQHPRGGGAKTIVLGDRMSESANKSGSIGRRPPAATSSVASAAQITEGSSSSSSSEGEENQDGSEGSNTGGATLLQALPVMPLIEHLKQGYQTQKPIAWHRNDERRARGLTEVANPRLQLESWERQLVWMEILLLSGTAQAQANSSFIHLAQAWGREIGFQTVLSHYICQRRGQVQRKAKTPQQQQQQQRETAN